MQEGTKKALEAFRRFQWLRKLVEHAEAEWETALNGAAPEDEEEYTEACRTVFRELFPTPAATVKAGSPLQAGIAKRLSELDRAKKTPAAPAAPGDKCYALHPSPGVGYRCKLTRGHVGAHRNDDAPKPMNVWE